MGLGSWLSSAVPGLNSIEVLAAGFKARSLHVLRWERNTLPCGYVTGTDQVLVAGEA